MKVPKAPRQGFTLMELIVVIAIIVALAAIAFPVYGKIKGNSNKSTALNVMRNLAGVIAPYAAENDGELPAQQEEEKDSWKATAEPDADNAWYNAFPRRLGVKGVGDFEKEKNLPGFYSKDNILFLPGATYPSGQLRLEKPLFAIAFNSLLHPKSKSDDGGEPAKKLSVKLSNVHNQVRTVAFIEQGLPTEQKPRDFPVGEQYYGRAQGDAKTFVARYTDRGVISFIDGHAEEVSPKDLLKPSGDILWEADWITTNPSAICWTPDPKDDPNEK